jgi:hypothetical protein
MKEYNSLMLYILNEIYSTSHYLVAVLVQKGIQQKQVGKQTYRSKTQ